MVMFLCGLIVLRTLSKEDFAIYTITQVSFSIMMGIADGGLVAAMNSEGGKAWPDISKLGGVMNAAFSIRLWVLPIAGLIGGVATAVSLVRFGSDPLSAIAITAVIVTTFVITAIGNVYAVVVRLNGLALKIQRLEIFYYLQRLAFLSVSLKFFPNTLVAVLCNFAAVIYSVLQARSWSRDFCDFTSPADNETRKRMLAVMRRMVPMAIYATFAPQIAILLMTVVGSVSGVADIGALSRLGQLLSIVGSINAGFFVPFFAREQEPKRLIQKFVIALTFCTSFCAGLIIAAALFPLVFLWLLGPLYRGLPTSILLLSLGGSAISTLSGVVGALANNRGHVLPPHVFIGINLVAQAVFLTLLPVSTLSGVLVYVIGIALVGLGLNMWLAYSFLRNRPAGHKHSLP